MRMCKRILGIILDKHLKFYKEVDFSLGRAKKTFGKMAYLLKGRVGICQKIGIGLFKVLAIPA